MPKNTEAETVNPTSAMAPSGELVPLQGGKQMSMHQFEQMLRETKEETADADVDPHMRIIQQVFAAETPDDVLTPVEAVKARDVIGHGLICHGFEFNESEFDVGSPMYASMRCTYVGLLPPAELDLIRIENPSPPQPFSPGEEIVVNTGHKKVLAQLVQLARLDAFPRRVVFAERGRSKVSGSSMLTLLKWGRDEDMQME